MSVRKIGSLQMERRPKMVVYHDDKDDINPYRVYFEWYDYAEDGYGLKKRKRLLAKYADMQSVGEMLRDFTWGII